MIIGKAISPFALRKKNGGGGGGTDPDAQLFITATGITGTNATATNQLVIDLKAANIWTKMKCIYPFVGNTASSQKYNLKDARDLDAAFRLAFNGGGTFSSNGYQPNGTNAFANTFHQPASFFSLGFYSRTNIDSTAVDIGLSTKFIYSKTSLIVPGSATMRISGLSWATFTVANSLGFVTGSRLNNSTFQSYKNGVLKLTTNEATFVISGYNAYIGAYNASGAAGGFSNRECAFAYFSDGLTDAESLALYNAVQLFNTTLGRQV